MVRSLVFIIAALFAVPAAAQFTIDFGGGGITIGNGSGGLVIAPKTTQSPTQTRSDTMQRVIVSPNVSVGDPRMAITTKNMNLRDAPNGAKHGGLPSGSRIQVQCAKSWCQIPDGRWVSITGLSFETRAAIPSPTTMLPIDPKFAPQTQVANAPADFSGQWTLIVDGSQVKGQFSQSGGMLQGAFVDGGNTPLPMQGQVKGSEAQITMILSNAGRTYVWTGPLILQAGGQQLSGILALQGTDLRAAVSGQRTQ